MYPNLQKLLPSKMPCSFFIVSLTLLVGTIRCAKISQKPELDNTPLSAPIGIPSSLSIENLQLNDNTRRRTTRGPLTEATTTTTHSPHAINSEQDGVLYRLDNKDGKACILMYTDAIIHFYYISNIHSEDTTAVYVPDKYEASGECDEDSSRFTISFGNFAWTTYFAKTPGGDHWFVENMQLDAKAEDKHLAHIDRPSTTTLHFTKAKDQGMLFPTPIGKAYDCDEEISVMLFDGDAKVKILLRKLVMQPFIFKKAEFGPRHTCSPGGAKSYRDETAPVAVGSTFAVVTILTVIGYGVYRYMKVKKVQYDTME